MTTPRVLTSTPPATPFRSELAAKIAFLLELSNDGVLVVDRQGLIAAFNDQASHTFRAEPGQLGGQVFRDLRARVPIQTLTETLSPANLIYEAWFLAFDGSRFLAEVSFSTISDGDDEFYIGIFRDITVRKEAAERDQLVSAVFQSCAQGTVITDAERRIVAVNPAFEEITGYQAAEVEGRDLANWSGTEEIDAEAWASVSGEGLWQGEISARHRNGRPYSQWVSITAVRSDDDTVSNYIALLADVTERKLADAKLRRMADMNAVLSAANQLIARAPPPEVLFDKICRSIVEHSNIALAWIDPMPGVEWKTVPVSSCSKRLASPPDGGNLETFPDGSHCLPEPGGGLPCAALSQCIDVQAALCLPIRQNGGLVAVLTVFTEDGEFFDEACTMLLHRLANDITFALDALALERQRRAAEERLAYLASHDTLTGLRRRPALEEVLAREHAKAQRSGRPYSVALIDIDNFKVINDSYGHAAGDDVLVHISAVLQDAMRAMDWVARWGGEEFLCLLPETDAEQAVVTMRRLQKRLAACGLTVGGRARRVTVSIGVATFPMNGENTSDLMAGADAALYQAKDRGGDCVLQARDSPGIFLIGARIEEALEDDRVVAAYQPIVSLAQGEPVADEALARVVFPDGTVAEARSFIDSATRLYLLHKIDQTIMGQALARCVRERQQQATGGCDRLHFVNASSALLCRTDLIEHFLASARAHCEMGAGPIHNRFVIEVTERSLLSDPDEARRNLEKLRGLGFQIALDDFGSGYSSFLYLLELPVSFVKIEQLLAGKVCTDRRAAAIVQGITAVARRLGLTTIAEGIEDAQTALALKELGVDWGQGYHFGKPVLTRD